MQRLIQRLGKKISILSLTLIIMSISGLSAESSMIKLDLLYRSPEFTEFTTSLYTNRSIEVIFASHTYLVEFLDSEFRQEPEASVIKAHALTLLGKHLISESYCSDPELGERLLREGEIILDTIHISDTRLQSQALAVEAELSGSLFLLDKMENLFTYGLASSNLIDEALELDIQNDYAKLLLVNKYIYTPKLFGGSTKKARKLLEDFDTNFTAFPEFVRFSLLQLQGMAASSRDEAVSWYQQALTLYPENRYVQELLAEAQRE